MIEQDLDVILCIFGVLNCLWGNWVLRTSPKVPKLVAATLLVWCLVARGEPPCDKGKLRKP